MQYGIKGTNKPASGSSSFDYSTTPLFTASATTTVILSACNQNSTDDTIRICVAPGSDSATSGTISAGYYLEYDYPLAGNTAIERTGITLEAQSRMWVGSGGGNVSFVAYGLES